MLFLLFALGRVSEILDLKDASNMLIPSGISEEMTDSNRQASHSTLVK